MEEDKILQYAEKVISLAKDDITVRFRFFDTALGKLTIVPQKGLGGYVTTPEELRYDPLVLLNDYKNEVAFPVRLLLHVLFHKILLHRLRKDKLNEEYWDIACDIAVENIILGLDIAECGLLRDAEEKIILKRLGKWVVNLTAEGIYREFGVGGISSSSRADYERIFKLDTHQRPAKDSPVPEMIITQKDWEKIAERVKASLKSFSQDRTGKDTILMNLKESTRKKYDYDSILERFAVMSEHIRVNPDEFDYIYYTYGLEHYENMPLIEPLEYTEENRVREFIIAIDTSASVRGKTVEGFLNKTYDILMKSDKLSDRLSIHIIQCDSKITSDIKVTSRSQLKDISTSFEVKGYGATDFRPVFEYVLNHKDKGEFKDLKGLIYFTDGYGIYPDKAPDYDVIFVFNKEDKNRMPLPGWAIKVILEDEE